MKQVLCVALTMHSENAALEKQEQRGNHTYIHLAFTLVHTQCFPISEKYQGFRFMQTQVTKKDVYLEFTFIFLKAHNTIAVTVTCVWHLMPCYAYSSPTLNQYHSLPLHRHVSFKLLCVLSSGDPKMELLLNMQLKNSQKIFKKVSSGQLEKISYIKQSIAGSKQSLYITHTFTNKKINVIRCP